MENRNAVETEINFLQSAVISPLLYCRIPIEHVAFFSVATKVNVKQSHYRPGQA
jgi:hypothetical protein